MSDLQCAATFVLVDTAADSDALHARRAAAVLSAPGSVDTADDLARLLDIDRRDLPAVATSAAGLVRALDDVADEYRGECAAVVVTPTALSALVRLVLPGERGAVVVEIDGDGHRWAPWTVGDR